MRDAEAILSGFSPHRSLPAHGDETVALASWPAVAWTSGVHACFLSALPGQDAIAQPFGHGQQGKQTAKRDAHQRDNQREPARIGFGARRRKTAQQGFKQNQRQQSRAQSRRTPLQQLAGSVVSFARQLWVVRVRTPRPSEPLETCLSLIAPFQPFTPHYCAKRSIA